MVLSPGQDLEELVSRLSLDSLTEIVGDDIVETITVLNPPGGLASALRSIAQEFLSLRPEEMFGNGRVRKVCYDAMTGDKLRELAERLGYEEWQKVETLNPLDDSNIWQRYVGFFGIDARGAAQVHIDPAEANIEPTVGLFEHQRRAVDRVWSALDGGFGRVVLHMPTGAGKTRTAMHIVSRFLNMHEPGVVVWLAASAELLDQAAEAFEQAWAKLGDRSVTLMRFWGDHGPDFADMQDGLVVAGFQKMHAFFAREPLGLLRLAAKVKLVVVDEAHQAIAPTYSVLITKLAETGAHNALLGLTATPGRTWSDIEADKKLSGFFGERKVTLEVDEGWNDPVSYLMSEGYLAKPAFRRLEYEPTTELKETLQAVTSNDEDYGNDALAALAQSIDRNVAIIREVERLVESDHRRILLFASSVRHAEIIAAALSAIGFDARVVTGTTPPLARRRIIRDFRSASETPMILCNFGVLTTGFDAPNTSAAVIARPTRSLVLFSQMVGRATRGPRAGGNETCEVSTVVDIALPGFGDVADAFNNWEDVWNEHG
ncbi:MAG: DEAD/DEAH box helicase [Rhodospirillaceae bacterium]|nr:DEAD/DEAH box helicase [Rhodospirillaceae bacterium]